MATIDRKVTGQRRRKGRRIQPYAWLGAGAVTLGLGAAMASGTAIAHADDGSDSGSRGASHSQAARGGSDSSSKATKATKRAAASSSVSSSGAKRASASRSAQKPADSDTAEEADIAAPAATAVRSDSGGSGAGDVASTVEAVATPKAVTRTRPAAARSAASSAAVADPVAAHVPSTPQAQTDPPWIPKDIVPGAAVTRAFQEISATQSALNANTWGTGNILGGLAALAPQALLTAASFELSAWQTLNPIAQNLVAATANIPIVKQIALVSVAGTMLLPALSQASLSGAALLMPVVGFFAPDAVAAASPQLAAAQKDGLVYAIVPVRMYNTTEPLVDVSINNGSRQPLLIDTGSSGLVISEDNVDLTGATYVSSGEGGYSGGIDYRYDTYLMPVDFGGGAASDAAYVNVVTAAWDSSKDPNAPGTNTDPSNYDNFLKDTGANGILGIGANAVGPGPGIPTTSLPGELSDGVLLYQNFWPLGLGGFMVFGPNPLPPKADPISGGGTGKLNVQIGNGGQTLVDSIIDSGGVYGTMPDNIVGPPYDTLPADYPGVDFLKPGTKISVYAPDGTFLYSFTTQSAPYAPISVDATEKMNTGYYAFQQGPVYISYRNDGPSADNGSFDYNNGGNGWTIFDYG